MNKKTEANEAKHACRDEFNRKMRMEGHFYRETALSNPQKNGKEYAGLVFAFAQNALNQSYKIKLNNKAKDGFSRADFLHCKSIWRYRNHGFGF
ncbi:MAG: hypothetical protein LBT55_08015 [Clostridiaceae bacterium]|jgi:hypothetical protein|nr:hypothetical protein [Clostridiaceae bacterium]